MENLNINAEKSTPKIDFNYKTGHLLITGQSYPEFAGKFYDPLIKWIEVFLKESHTPLVMELTLIYINTSSIKMIFTLFGILEKNYKAGKNITINWYYDPENEVAKECGEESKEDLTLPFNIIEKVQ